MSRNKLQIFRFLAIGICISFCSLNYALAQKDFTFRVVATNLVVPWEIEWGPDGMLWVTERPGIVSRINPETGAKQVLLDLRDSVYFLDVESGMLGFVLHPDFLQTPYLYLTYIGGDTVGEYRVVKRYEYVSDTLINPVDIYRIAPAGPLHNGSRLVIGPDNKLYVTAGDHDQKLPALDENSDVGKILRMNLDGTIPDDNPVPGRYMWSKGHRNPQGLVVLPNGNLWSSEHGSSIEDEVNLIVKGGNYGWPRVEGPCDVELELGYCDSNNVINPRWSSGNMIVAPSNLEYYNSVSYPVFANSLLLATLKANTLFQLRLNERGDSIVEVQDYFNRSLGRIRDIAVSPDGRIFLCSSNREANQVYPYPEFDDDKIVEVIPLPDTVKPIYSGPDTLFVKARVGDELVFHSPIGNVGSGSFRITWVGQLDTNSFLQSNQWRVPITLLPGKSYGIEFIFIPPEEGEYYSRTLVSTREIGDYFINLKGSTHVGVLDAVNDTIVRQCDNCIEELIRVPFVNTGTDTVTVTGAVIEGPDSAAFLFSDVDTGVIQPGDTAYVTVRSISQFPEIRQIMVRIESTSYRDASSTLFVMPVTSVDSDQSDELTMFVYPNPFSSKITIIVPKELAGEPISIYNSVGSLMYRLESGPNQSVVWDPASAGNFSLSRGTYLAFVTNGKSSAMSLIFYLGQ